MKTKVEIENGRTLIVLTPENKFEEDVLEKSYSDDSVLEIKLHCDHGQFLSSDKNYRLEIEIKEPSLSTVERMANKLMEP